MKTLLMFLYVFLSIDLVVALTHRRMAWGVKRGRRRPQATCPVGRPLLKWPSGGFRGSLPAGHKRVGHGGPG
jgi:hypothetical protein